MINWSSKKFFVNLNVHPAKRDFQIKYIRRKIVKVEAWKLKTQQKRFQHSPFQEACLHG